VTLPPLDPAVRAAAKARTLLSLGRPEGAIAELSAALAVDPQSAELLRLLAQAQLQADDAVGALRTIGRAVAAEPDNEWGHRLASVAYTNLGDFRQAVGAAAEAQRLAPLEWRTHARRSLAAAQAGCHGDAIQAGLRAAQLAPDEPDAHFALGFAYAKNKDLAEAERAYQRVLAMKPDHAQALNNLGTIRLRQRGGLRRATAGYGAALAIDAQLKVAQRNLDVVARRYMRRFHLSVVAAYFIFETAFGSSRAAGSPTQVSSSSRLAAAIVGGVALVFLVGSMVVVDRRLPRNLRRYYHRLPRKDVLLGAWLVVDLAALVLIGCLAIPATVAGRSDLAELIWLLIFIGLGLSWLPRLLRRVSGPNRRG
jgi:tetratricopeptide (TPR) repeat protein